MRLVKKGRISLFCRGQMLLGALRPLSGTYVVRRYGAHVQDVLRVLLPWGAPIHPGDAVQIEDASYVCLYVRALPGHVQADLRRCPR